MLASNLWLCKARLYKQKTCDIVVTLVTSHHVCDSRLPANSDSFDNQINPSYLGAENINTNRYLYSPCDPGSQGGMLDHDSKMSNILSTLLRQSVCALIFNTINIQEQLWTIRAYRSRMRYSNQHDDHKNRTEIKNDANERLIWCWAFDSICSHKTAKIDRSLRFQNDVYF